MWTSKLYVILWKVTVLSAYSLTHLNKAEDDEVLIRCLLTRSVCPDHSLKSMSKLDGLKSEMLSLIKEGFADTSKRQSHTFGTFESLRGHNHLKRK